MLKPNKLFYLDFIAILFELEKICIFQNCIFRPRKSSLCSKYSIQTVKICFGIFRILFFSRIFPAKSVLKESQTDLTGRNRHGLLPGAGFISRPPRGLSPPSRRPARTLTLAAARPRRRHRAGVSPELSWFFRFFW